MFLTKKNAFGHNLFLKKWLVRILGILSHTRFRGIDKMYISGTHVIENLPEKNVLFISNHQTYFADVAAMIHVINATLSGRNNNIKNIGYLWKPKMNLYFVAAKETMKSGLLPKLMAHAGSISIDRTWRSKGESIQREVKSEDVSNIDKALNDGWLITFPQGTTKAWTPVRKGTAHIIKKNKPIVVPIVIDGFRRSFDKKGLVVKKKGVLKSFDIKDPLEINYEADTVEDIVNKIEFAIEQHQSLKKV
jgi:1-acyl-sn-glycerol-3-phosphate acyltransferase